MEIKENGDEIIYAIIDSCYETCNYCRGGGDDPDNPIFSCHICNGEGKQISWAGKTFLNFISANINIKVQIGR